VRPLRSIDASRRSFLRYAALSGGLLTLSRLPISAVRSAVAAQDHLQVLNPYEASIFSAVGQRMVASDDPAMPKFGDTQAIFAIDQALLQLDDGLQTQLKILLRLVQWGPPIFMLRLIPFTRMDGAMQDRYLQGWASSPSQVRLIGFRALKNLSMLGYYSQDAVWPAIHYPGPWLPRARRVVSA
jgi:hypothetical protein